MTEKVERFYQTKDPGVFQTKQLQNSRLGFELWFLSGPYTMQLLPLCNYCYIISCPLTVQLLPYYPTMISISFNKLRYSNLGCPDAPIQPSFCHRVAVLSFWQHHSRLNLAFQPKIVFAKVQCFVVKVFSPCNMMKQKDVMFVCSFLEGIYEIVGHAPP